MSHSVVCGDFFHYMDRDEEWTVDGFRTAEAALEYARRFVRDQVEAMREEYDSPAALKQAFMMFGEYAITEGFELSPWLDFCIETPATRRSDTDYQALDPSP